jgi:tetratricopeptide (TPR) repeat protein
MFQCCCFQNFPVASGGHELWPDEATKLETAVPLREQQRYIIERSCSTPGAARFDVQYAHMLKEIGRFREAEAAYRHAASQLPGAAEVRLQLAHFLKLTGRIQEALESYKKVLGLLPANGESQNLVSASSLIGSDALSDALRHEALVRKGDCLRDARRHADAAEAYGARLLWHP